MAKDEPEYKTKRLALLSPCKQLVSPNKRLGEILTEGIVTAACWEISAACKVHLAIFADFPTHAIRAATGLSRRRAVFDTSSPLGLCRVETKLHAIRHYPYKRKACQ